MSLVPLYLINFINALGFSIVVPYLVFWAADFGGSSAIYGALGAIYAGFQLIGAPVLGSASDRYGRKKMLFVSQFGTLIAWFVVLAALTVPLTSFGHYDTGWLGEIHLTLPLILLIAARAFDGLTAGNIAIANAYLADVSKESEKSDNFGKMAAASSLGFILGPGLAGLMATDKQAVYLAIGVSIIGLLAVFFFLKETKCHTLDSNPCTDEMKRMMGAEIKDNNDKTRRDFFALIKDSRILSLFLLYFVIYLGFNIFYSTFPLMARNNLEWSPQEMGYFFSFLSICMVVVQVVLLPRANKLCSEKQLIFFGSILLAASKILLFFESQFIWLMPLLFALGNGVMWPSFLAILSRHGSTEDQGSIQGYGSSFGSFASIIGLVIGSILFANFGTVIFLGAALMFGVVAIYSSRLNPPPKRT